MYVSYAFGSVFKALVVPQKRAMTNLRTYFVELTVWWREAAEEPHNRKKLKHSDFISEVEQRDLKRLSSALWRLIQGFPREISFVLIWRVRDKTAEINTGTVSRLHTLICFF